MTATTCQRVVDSAGWMSISPLAAVWLIVRQPEDDISTTRRAFRSIYFARRASSVIQVIARVAAGSPKVLIASTAT